jgi:hypothetical protein
MYQLDPISHSGCQNVVIEVVTRVVLGALSRSRAQENVSARTLVCQEGKILPGMYGAAVNEGTLFSRDYAYEGKGTWKASRIFRWVGYVSV